MRKIVLVSVTALALAPVAAHAQWTIQSSPYSIQNSPYNIQNSPYSIQNSPYSIPNTPGAIGGNGIYGNNGQWQGYAVPRPDGGLNVFDPSGNRTGYVPGYR